LLDNGARVRWGYNRAFDVERYRDLRAAIAAAPSSRAANMRNTPRLEYFLTAKGWELGPILLAMKKWGEKHVGIGSDA